jgi:hypothetical protein
VYKHRSRNLTIWLADVLPILHFPLHTISVWDVDYNEGGGMIAA